MKETQRASRGPNGAALRSLRKGTAKGLCWGAGGKASEIRWGGGSRSTTRRGETKRGRFVASACECLPVSKSACGCAWVGGYVGVGVCVGVCVQRVVRGLVPAME